MGRTGRKREGRIVVLLTKGKEEQVSHNEEAVGICCSGYEASEQFLL